MLGGCDALAVAVSKKPWVSASVTQLNKSRVHSIIQPSPSVKSTFDIFSTLHIDGGKRKNHSIDVAKHIIGESHELPIDSYLFGLWTGDGYSKNPVIGMLESDWKTIEIHVPKPDSEKIATKPPRKQPFLDRRFAFMLRSLMKRKFV